MAYSEKVIDHYENPRNVGKMDAEDPDVGTGMVGAPACGDVMRLQIMACCRIVVTSGCARFVAVRFAGGSGSSVPGVGRALLSSGGPSPMCPMPTRTRLLSSPRYVIRTSTSPVGGKFAGRRTTTDFAQG